MTRINKFQTQAGFTLIELLIAVTVLAIGLLALAGLQGSSIKGNEHANTISQATALAEEAVELIRNMPYAQVTYANLDLSGEEDVDYSNGLIEANIDGSIYTRTTRIEDNTPLNDLKRITVTVSWTSRGVIRQVQLRTIIANEG